MALSTKVITDIFAKYAYRYTRFWLLHELRRVRASVRIGTQSITNACKERKALQRELAKLRAARRVD